LAPERCDQIDNNRDGRVDNLTAPCDTGALGICAQGALTCGPMGEECTPVQQPRAEICGDMLDNDSDGDTDELDCVALAAGETCSFPWPTRTRWACPAVRL